MFKNYRRREKVRTERTQSALTAHLFFVLESKIKKSSHVFFDEKIIFLGMFDFLRSQLIDIISCIKKNRKNPKNIKKTFNHKSMVWNLSNSSLKKSFF